MTSSSCATCGWPTDHNHTSNECWVKAGAAADRLALSLQVPCVKRVDQSAHRVTFMFDERHSITFKVSESGRLFVDRIRWDGAPDQASAKALIEALSAVARNTRLISAMEALETPTGPVVVARQLRASRLRRWRTRSSGDRRMSCPFDPPDGTGSRNQGHE